MMDIHSVKLLIGAESCEAVQGTRFEVRSPATGEVVGSVAKADSADIALAVQAAQKAFTDWSKKTPYEREKIMRQATAQVRLQADDIGRLMALEQGKPAYQSRCEIIASCDTIDYYAAEGLRVEGYTNPTEKAEYRSWVTYQPVGVCALITPWNYPVSLLSWKLGPALAAGCSVIVKPTTVTPMSPTAFCAALIEGGIPGGVINVLNGPGGELGEALVKHSAIAKVAMTGSSETGKKLMSMTAPWLKKISLELGGHCPAIVCEDADVDLAAKIIAYKGFRNMGQSCSSINRVYVHQSLHDELTQELRRLAERQSIGDGVTDGSVDLGPMATKSGLETVKRHIADAVGKGACLVCGGKGPEGEAYALGHYFLPTILTQCTHDMLVMKEETFGPVVPLVSFESIDQAVQLANDSSYGLVSYLFTSHYPTTIRVSEALETGTVCVNHGAVNTDYGPYCGWKDSGFGMELSRRAIFEYLKTKHIKVAFS